jgi:predicted nicotinamide N-methyase
MYVPTRWRCGCESCLTVSVLGTALPSLVCALTGAASTTITDHPSSPALTTGAIQQNVRVNVTERNKSKASTGTTDSAATEVQSLPENQSPQAEAKKISVFGYTWGTTTFYNPATYGKPAHDQPVSFDRIILADCLWMPSQHVNLVKTILHYLETSRSDSCALVVAGFHTGRGIVRHFFQVATGEYTDASGAEQGAKNTEEGRKISVDRTEMVELEKVQGRLRAVEMFEIDVDGRRRPWEPVREGESKHTAKRWCVVAVLVRR